MKFEHIKQNINGEITEKFYVNDKEVSKEEYDKALDYNNKDGIKKDLNKNYLTSKEFNIFETVKFLSENPDWRAKRKNKTYKINDNGTLVCDKDGEIGDNLAVEITEDTLNYMFKLLPPESMEEWEDVDVKVAFRMLQNGKTEKIRSVDVDYEVYDEYSAKSNFKRASITPYEITFCKWQYLKKYNKN